MILFLYSATRPLDSWPFLVFKETIKTFLVFCNKALNSMPFLVLHSEKTVASCFVLSSRSLGWDFYVFAFHF